VAGSIGKASLILGTTNRIGAGLEGAYSQINGWKNKVTAAVGGLNIGGLAGLAGAGPLGVAFGAAVGGAKLFGDALGRVKDLADTSKLAKNIGVTGEAYMGLAASAERAGVSGDEFGSLLQKGSAKIAGGSTDAAAALGMIGLNITALKALSPDKQFLAIADGLKNTGDAGKRASVAMKLYEEGGLKLLPVLTKGSAGLQEFAAEQKKLGLVLSDDSLKAAERAKAALPKIQAAFTGLFNRVAVSMAPLIEAVAANLSKVLAKLGPVFDWVGRAAEAYYGVLGPAVGEVLDAFSAVAQAAGEWIGETFAFAGEFPSIGEVITGVMKFVGVSGAYAWDVIKGGAGAVAVAVSYVITAFQKLVSAFADVLKFAKELPEAVRPSWANDLGDGADAFAARIGRAAAETDAWGKRQLGAFGQSAVQVEAWFERLKAKKAEVETVAPNVDVPAAAAAAGKAGANTALIAGTKEELSARIKFDQAGQTVASQQLAEQKKSNLILERTVDKLGNIELRLAPVTIPEV